VQRLFLNLNQTGYENTMPYDNQKLLESETNIIGWKEWLSLPELAIPAIKAKIDTGARTSSLHTFSLEEFAENGKRMVRFGIHPLQKRSDVELFCQAPVIEQRNVKDSGGHVERRYVIETTAVLGAMRWPIQLTLTNRDGMLFRMLLGRTALSDRFVVLPGEKYLTGRSLYLNNYGRKNKKGA
jgi:hypothetical protein